jgi:site-specific recombinase
MPYKIVHLSDITEQPFRSLAAEDYVFSEPHIRRLLARGNHNDQARLTYMIKMGVLTKRQLQEVAEAMITEQMQPVINYSNTLHEILDQLLMEEQDDKQLPD